MAQMVAKAMAKTDVSAADKAMIDKLAAEFADELNNLGVRVSNLEKHADMVKWNGELRYTYSSRRVDDASTATSATSGWNKDKKNKDELLFRLEPTAEVNDHWQIKARLDAKTDMASDEGDDGNVKLKRAYAQGNYKNFQTQLGKFGFYTPEQGLVFDDELSGANVTFGSDIKATLYAGRLDLSDGAKFPADTTKHDDAANLQGITLQYANAAKSKLSGGAAYYHLSSDAFKGISDQGVNYADGANNEDTANIWSVNAAYKFDNTSKLSAAFAQNTDADNLDTSWQALYNYKGAQAANKGTWGAYAGYRYLGTFASLYGTQDAQTVGAKGWEIGADYTPFKNVVATAKYFNGKTIETDKDASTLWGRLDFKF
jgi:hypothetical protein